jgi:CBS domain containing-hemolysin-like protein
MIAFNFIPSFLASAGEAPMEFPSLLEVLLYLSGIIFFLLLNAFFVASEFAIVKVRSSQVETIAKEKPVAAARVMSIMGSLQGYLSANQLGITIASLALGFLGEPFVVKLVGPLLGMIPGLSEKVIKGIAFVIAIMSFTFLHVVVGELMPKSIAISRPLGTTLLLSGPLHLFYKTFNWAVTALNNTSIWLLKTFFRIEVTDEHDSVHSAEELAVLVAESGNAKEVTETEREILMNALELNELWVRDVMTPRQDVILLDADDPFEKTLDVALRSKHTRFPLVKGGHLDNSLGLIHVKDILKLIGDPDPDLMRIKRELKMVPDTMPLDVLLKFFLKERAHLAMAMDEFGTPVGIVFLDNVMEELVGDIQDEFDNERSESTWINENEFVVEGTMTLNDLTSMADELELESGEVTTVGGYITQQLGRFPEVGESMEIHGWEAKVTSTDGRRVGQVHFRKLTEADSDDASDEGEDAVA